MSSTMKSWFRKKDPKQKLERNDVAKTEMEPVGNSSSTEESAKPIDPREGLFVSKKGRMGVGMMRRRKNSEKIQIISARDGPDKFKASDVRDSMLHETGFKNKRSSTVPKAKDSAYTGPPRYDWIDVEAAAAVKVQSVYRRHMVLTQLEKDGKSTAAMRNKIRARHAKKQPMSGEDVPTFFRFCGIGSLFADATGEDTLALEEAAKRDEKFNDKINKDKKLRAFKMRNKATTELEESVEVVDNI